MAASMYFSFKELSLEGVVFLLGHLSSGSGSAAWTVVLGSWSGVYDIAAVYRIEYFHQICHYRTWKGSPLAGVNEVLSSPRGHANYDYVYSDMFYA